MNKNFDDIFSRLDTIHQRDGRTDNGRQQSRRLCIASRGKKNCHLSWLSEDSSTAVRGRNVQENYARVMQKQFIKFTPRKGQMSQRD